jgi:hypothetical protein
MGELTTLRLNLGNYDEDIVERMKINFTYQKKERLSADSLSFFFAASNDDQADCNNCKCNES